MLPIRTHRQPERDCVKAYKMVPTRTYQQTDVPSEKVELKLVVHPAVWRHKLLHGFWECLVYRFVLRYLFNAGLISPCHCYLDW